MRKKLILVTALVLVFSCAFTLFVSAHDETMRYRLILDSSNTCSATVYKDSISPTYLTCPYGDRFYYGSIEYSRYWCPQLYQYTTTNDPNGFVIFNFGFSNLELKGYIDGQYYIAFAVSFSDQFGITIFPDGTVIQFVDSLGVATTLSYNVDGNVAYIRTYVTQEYSGSFQIRVNLNFDLEAQTTARYINISSIVFERPYLQSDIADSIADAIISSGDKNTDAILNDTGDGSITGNVSAGNSSVNNMGQLEDEIMAAVPDKDSVAKPNYDTNLGSYQGSFDYLGTALTGTIDAFGAGYNKLWWTLIALGLFGSVCGIIIMISKRSGK